MLELAPFTTDEDRSGEINTNPRRGFLDILLVMIDIEGFALLEELDEEEDTMESRHKKMIMVRRGESPGPSWQKKSNTERGRSCMGQKSIAGNEMPLSFNTNLPPLTGSVSEK